MSFLSNYIILDQNLDYVFYGSLNFKNSEQILQKGTYMYLNQQPGKTYQQLFLCECQR